MEIIYRQDAELLSWAGDQLGRRWEPQSAVTIAVMDGPCLLCVVVYSRFSAFNCEMSIASTSPRWCSRRFLRAAFSFPFAQLKLCRVTIVTTPGNAKAIDMIERLGAKQEGVLRCWFGDSDGLVFGILREECKWLKTCKT